VPEELKEEKDFLTKMRFFRKGREFKRLYSEGRRYSRESFTFLVVTGAESAAGIVLSRKVGKANKRNKLKRRLRHYFRDFWLLTDRQVVVIGKKGSGFLNWLEVKGCLDSLQKAIGNRK